MIKENTGDKMQPNIVTIIIIVIAVMIFVTMCASIITACNTENIKNLMLYRYKKEKEKEENQK